MDENKKAIIANLVWLPRYATWKLIFINDDGTVEEITHNLSYGQACDLIMKRGLMTFQFTRVMSETEEIAEIFTKPFKGLKFRGEK